MIPEDSSLKEIQDIFVNDRFASEACGAVITHAERGHAICEMVIKPSHFNAMGGVMGGAIFSLADFALAIACNIGESPTVSVSNTIEFCSKAKGDKLIAECQTDKSGRSLGFYTVKVSDDLGNLVANMTATCFRTPEAG